MLEINKKKLVPGIVATWGDITGNVENQEDLVEYIDNHTPEVVWGGITGDIAAQEDLQEELSGKQDTLVSGVNIKTVNDQSLLGPGNITIEGGGEDNVIEIVKVNGTALTPDVNKAVDVIVPTKTSDLTNDSGYLTDEDPVIEPLLEQEIVELGNSAAFKNVGIDRGRQDGNVYNIGGNIYYNSYGRILKFNRDSRLFEYVCESPDYKPMWEDNSGNVHIGANYIIDLSTGLYNYSEIGGVYINNWNRHNIVKIGDLIYQISVNDSLAYIFDEENQTFWNHSVPCDCNYASWYERQLNFNGHIVYVRSGSMYELVPYFENEGDTYPTRLDCVQLSTPLYPTIDGSLPTSSYVAKANDVWYYLGKNDHTIYYLDEVQNEWKLINDFVVPDNYIISLNGAYANDDYVFGYGYVSGENTMLVWYFGESEYEYKFIVDINDKIEAVNDKIPSGTLVTEENLKTINGVSIVGSGDIEVGGLTPAQEDAVEVLTNSSKGALYTDQLDPYIVLRKSNTHIGEPWGLNQVDDDVYYFYNQELSKFNKDTLNFDYITRLDSAANQVLWRDATGRLYDGRYMIDLVNSTEVYIDMGSPSSYENDGRNNILYGEYGIWCVDQYNLQKFDESTQRFIDGYTVNVPVDYQDNLAYCMTQSFKYDGHILYDSATSTYEIVEYEDHIDVVDVTNTYYTRPSFGFVPSRMFGTDSGLFYMSEYDYYRYNSENNEWDRISISGDNTYFSYRYAVTGDFLLGGFYFTNGEYCITNLGNTWKKTSWIDVKDIVVDLSSDQYNIKGVKNFKSGLQTSSLTIENSVYGNGWIRMGQDNSHIDAQKNLNLSVPGICTLNDKYIAITDQCILNRSYSYPGPRIKGVAGIVNMNSYYIYHFVTPSGRLIYSDPNMQAAYEFDGTQWTQLQTVTTFVTGEWRVEINDGLYVINNNNSLYRWDDTNSDWVFIINMPEQNIWAADANTLRCGAAYKLVNNGGTYEWDTSDPTSSYSYQKSLKVGQTYYQTVSNGVFTYDDSVKDFILVGNTQFADGNHWFTFNGCLYYFNYSSVRKVDPSQVGTDQWDTATNIYYGSWDSVYVEYDSKIWTVKYNDSLGYNQLGYTYDVTESVPAVPAQDGTYVLKATVLNGQVTYSWVVEV